MSDIEQAVARIKDSAVTCARYCAYYDGRHPLAFATEKYRTAFYRVVEKMRDNLMPAVVSAVADRLEVIGFSVDGRPEERPEGARDAGDDAWDLWRANRMPARAGQVHKEALKTGEAFVLVWAEEGQGTQPSIYPQRPGCMAVVYDEEQPGTMLWAAKAWRQEADGRWRLTLYYPNRIEKYVTEKTDVLPEKSGSFKEFAPTLTHPYERVPVFHFRNDPDLGESRGRSDLRDAIPIQDALNKSLADMLVAMEFSAFRQRWFTGIELEEDEATGKLIEPWKVGQDRMVGTGEKDAKFGDFESTDLKQYLGVQDSLRLEVARVTGTPLHYMALITDPPSGEALKTLDSRNIKKCQDRQIDFGDTWEDALAFGLKIMGKEPDARLVTLWADPAPKSEREKAETLGLLVTAGASVDGGARVAGYTDEEVSELVGGELVDAGLRQ